MKWDGVMERKHSNHSRSWVHVHKLKKWKEKADGLVKTEVCGMLPGGRGYHTIIEEKLTESIRDMKCLPAWETAHLPTRPTFYALR